MPRRRFATVFVPAFAAVLLTSILAACGGGGGGGSSVLPQQSAVLPASTPASSSSGTAAPAATVAPGATSAPAATPLPAAPAIFPDHVRTHAYYGLNGINAAVPATWMAKHVDIVEDDGFTAQHALAFKQAGGAFAIAYTDPTYVPYCVAPFAEPAGACSGPIGNLVQTSPGAWMHDASGARIRHQAGPAGQYQEMLDVASLLAQRAYAQTTAAIVAANPLLDGFEADDSGSTFTVNGGSLGNNLFWDFSGSGVEIASDQAWIAGETAMFSAAGKPVMINGSSGTEGPAYNGAFLALATVFGQQFEGYINNAGGYLYADGQFSQEENGVLAVQALRKLALMMPSGAATSANRLYAFAAFMLVYDPTYSVLNMEITQSDGYSLYPETQLVPLQPLATAVADIATLKKNGSYVREFAACAIATLPIGACAAVVNASSTASVSVGGLTGTYAHHVVLDANSLYTGGKANVVAGGVVTLAPKTAAILVR